MDDEAEVHLIAIACSASPEGREHWTLRLLKREMVKRKYVVQVSHETVRTALKKRTQTVVEGDVLHLSESRYCFCVSDV